MGAYMTIHNDTPNTWRCMLSPDQKALKIGFLVAAGIASFSTATGIWGAYLPTLLGLRQAAGTELVFGSVTVQTFKRIASSVESYGFLTASAGSVTAFTTNLIRLIQEEYTKHDYVEIPVNGSHRWGKMPALAWRQATCVRSYKVNDSAIRTETLYMRPIFSGSFFTQQHNLNHSITHWLEKRRLEITDIVARPQAFKRPQEDRIGNLRATPNNDTVIST
uniref:Uncharacterized protein AlNc14C189G8398 n=1 Tax=Albugo laibachii Nc14 TaxID=890382 RepID=F0WPQ6_9STRA|nr:conserved hypothetical protein [Albugo laibachii Nc14]CCA24357.1 conserved hypothetical protein [Albugo laibachii Nc14]|eukprot:CCA24357.1 conserved hypothetical protein [Albugo laibachii Nc14]